MSSWLVLELSPEGDSLMEIQFRALRSHPKREIFLWECSLGVLEVSRKGGLSMGCSLDVPAAIPKGRFYP